jgi:Flp pilus assembly protein TadG
MKLATTMVREKRRHGWDEGATAVETALIFSVLMLLLFGIVEFGFALWQWNTMTLAVQQAGRWAMIHNTDTNIASDAESQMQYVLTTAAVCTTPTAGQICVKAQRNAGTPPAPSTIKLTAAYNFNLMAPYIPSFNMTSQAFFPLD